MFIQIYGNCVYEVTVDECGECVQLLGEYTEMSEQEKDYYNI